MPFLDTPDTIIAQLTLEGRNLLARCKTGDLVYRVVGWLWGRGGYLDSNPVKVSPIVDTGAASTASIQIIFNIFDQGNFIAINGRKFAYNANPSFGDFVTGATIPDTVQNILTAILAAKDPAYYRLAQPYVDPASPDILRFNSLLVGEIGNQYPITVYEIHPGSNFVLSGMSGGVSASLIDPAWPVGGGVLPFSSPDGGIELPSDIDVSFLTRVGEGLQGVGAYGEVGIFVEVLSSTFTAEVGRRVLFAIAHKPIDVKADRSILTSRVVIGF